jgi:hypothetical protein
MTRLGRHSIRNIFDQYKHEENRLTHALVQVLARDPQLASDFISFATGTLPPRDATISLSCQVLPGEDNRELADEDATEHRGIPDAWVYDERSSWAVAIECKVTAPLESDQLRRHLSTARRRFDNLSLLVITRGESPPPEIRTLAASSPVAWASWPQVFGFFTRRGHLVADFVNYMRVLEARLMAKEKDGLPLTQFTGVPFGPDYAYSEGEAKVVLRALMSELRPRLKASRILPHTSPLGRPAMAGSWDIVRFSFASAEPFTRYPHLTVSLEDKLALVQLVLPNNAQAKFWHPIRTCSMTQLLDVLTAVAERIRPVRRLLEKAIWEPELKFIIKQRHFYAMREPTLDADLQFNVDTLLDARHKLTPSVRTVPAWLDAVHVILTQSRRANFEANLQALFPYSNKSICKTPDFVDALVKCSEAFAPFLSLIRSSE